MKYRYLVTRTMQSSIEVEVEAENATLAQEAAIEKAENIGFPEDYYADYEIVRI